MPATPLFGEMGCVLARIEAAGRVLIALDYDGTLAPLANTPEEAQISPEMQQALAALAADPRFAMAIVSGRSLADLRTRLRLPAATYVGNHGLEIEGGGISFRHAGATLARDVVDQASWDVEAALLGIRGVKVERKGLTSTVHYRNAPSHIEHWIRATIGFVLGPYRALIAPVDALRAVEIRPRVDWHKGTAVRWLLDRLETEKPGLVCAGDDVADENMFDLLSSEVSIKVGGGANTRARYWVRDVSELLRFVQTLAAGCHARTGKIEGLSLSA